MIKSSETKDDGKAMSTMLGIVAMQKNPYFGIEKMVKTCQFRDITVLLQVKIFSHLLFPVA